MKPFNLEEALAGKKVITRDGDEVLQITSFSTDNQNGYSVVGVLNGEIDTWSNQGAYSICRSGKHPRDLFMAEEEIAKYQNIYAGGTWSAPRGSIEDAKGNAYSLDSPIAILKITINPDTKKITTEIVHTY